MLLMGKMEYRPGRDPAVKTKTYKIWKYPLVLDDVAEVKMPVSAVVMKFDLEGGDPRSPALWATVDMDFLDTRVRRFRVAGTGHPLVLEPGDMWHYIGTAQSGPAHTWLVWHCFEILYPAPEGYTGNILVPVEIQHYQAKFGG